MRDGGKFLAGFILISAAFLGGYFAHGTDLMSETSWLPTPGRTPGASTTKTAAQLCAKGYTTKSVRPPEDYTEPLKKKQLKQARYHDKNPAHYEEDHLISLEIGGDPKSPRNLWPQPYNGKCGAHVKDKLENKLHDLVCAGKVTLGQAQHDIATNWVAAYNHYIGELKCP